jgi:hypothetical protein
MSDNGRFWGSITPAVGLASGKLMAYVMARGSTF